jgi:SpoVK/Ycf46/Vps4 family AAA+-type ATPase
LPRVSSLRVDHGVMRATDGQACLGGGLHRRGRGHRVRPPGGPSGELEIDERAAAADPENSGLGEHLLACATDWVALLDPAFLRPGRVDYVLAVGPPDREARVAIWRRYVEDITDAEVDVSVLVDATELFTPADIEFAARKAAQHAFECEHFGRTAKRATTQDFLAAIEQTRPTLAQDIVEGSEEDRSRFVRYRRPGPAADLAGAHSRRVS